ncbi:MAG: TolB family protein, partial [Planctomycetota bacterium]
MRRAAGGFAAVGMRGGVALPACLCVALLGGCSAVLRAPARRIEELLPAARDGWNRPLRFTRGPGAEFDADYDARREALVYVSDRDGTADIYLQDGALVGLQPARRLTEHSARDRHPRFDPSGRRLAFVSTREDGAGDVWTLHLRRWLRGPRLRQLTGMAAADDQPCWHPDGERIFYAAGRSPGDEFGLWEVRPGGEPGPLSEGEGQMPDCSPDGRYVAFASRRHSGDADIYALRLADGAVARVTEGPAVDLHPAWSRDGRRLYFARIAFDSSGGGRLDRADVASIFAVGFSDGAFEGGQPAMPRQLTSFAFADGYPRPLPGGFLFTRALGGGNTDVFALGRSGEGPDAGTLSAFVNFARRVDREQPGAVHRRILAWQNAAWAASESAAGGAVKFDLERPGDGAAAWLALGRAWLDLGQELPAQEAFETLVEAFPPASAYVGLAEL